MKMCFRWDQGNKAPGRRLASFVGAEIWVQTAKKVSEILEYELDRCGKEAKIDLCPTILSDGDNRKEVF